jgi:hypothetical protein
VPSSSAGAMFVGLPSVAVLPALSRLIGQQRG